MDILRIQEMEVVVVANLLFFFTFLVLLTAGGREHCASFCSLTQRDARGRAIAGIGSRRLRRPLAAGPPKPAAAASVQGHRRRRRTGREPPAGPGGGVFASQRPARPGPRDHVAQRGRHG